MGSVQHSRVRLLGKEMKVRPGKSHNAYHLAQCEQRLTWHWLKVWQCGTKVAGDPMDLMDHTVAFMFMFSVSVMQKMK